MPRTEETIEYNPPKAWTVRGVGGPVVAIARRKIEPLNDGGRRSRLTLALDFEGRGIGRLLVPLVLRRQSRRQLPTPASLNPTSNPPLSPPDPRAPATQWDGPAGRGTHTMATNRARDDGAHRGLLHRTPSCPRVGLHLLASRCSRRSVHRRRW